MPGGLPRNRGVQDIFIACVDGLKGFPEAIESVNMSLRKLTKNRGSFPSDDALTRFTIQFEERIPQM